MIESIIMLLIAIVVIAIGLVIVLHVLKQVGFAIPAKVIQLVWLLFGLIVLLLIMRQFLSSGWLHLSSTILGISS